MKRLIILRHAKAIPHGAAPDFERTLAPRGLSDAAAAGKELASENLLPDVVLVSPARRTAQTWEQVSAALPEAEVRMEEGIYEAPASRLLALVRGLSRKHRTAMLVGHNPGLSDLARSLVGHGDRYAFARMREKFPTSAFAVIDFPVEEWGDLDQGGGRLDRFVCPGSSAD
jgi:phosphohistidine phosphatase